MKTLLILVISMILFNISCAEKTDDTKLLLSGTAEADKIRVSSLVAGKIKTVKVFEGQLVKEGDILYEIDSSDYILQLNQAKTQLDGAKAKFALVVKGSRREDIAGAKEALNLAGINRDKMKKEHERLSKLFSAGTVTEKDYDDMKTQLQKAESQYEQTKHVFEKVVNGAQKEDILLAKSGVDAAEAAIKIIEKKISDSVVKSPSNGIIINKISEIGEVVSPGMTMCVISDLSVMKIKAFVPESDLGKIKLGMDVSLKVDSSENEVFAGKVSRISETAEFTPKTIQTKDERVKTVYEFEVTADNKKGVFKLGMPVDVVVNLK